MDFSDFNGVKVARRVEIMMAGKVGMRINVTELGPAGKVDAHMFSIKGHGWVRAVYVRGALGAMARLGLMRALVW